MNEIVLLCLYHQLLLSSVDFHPLKTREAEISYLQPRRAMRKSRNDDVTKPEALTSHIEYRPVIALDGPRESQSFHADEQLSDVLTGVGNVTPVAASDSSSVP
jgi:hypothetical protein